MTPPKPTPKKRESWDDPDHHNELVPGEVSPHSSSTPFFSLSPLDVLSFIDVLQVFLLLEFSLGVNPQKKVVEEKVKQDPTKHLRSNTSLYGYWFWVFYIQGKKEEMKSRLTRCQWSLSGLLKLWLMEYKVGCVIIQKSFAEKLFLKTDQGKHQWKVGILRLEVAWDRKIMLRWIKLPLGFQYVAVSLLFGGIFVLHVHEVIWIFVSWFPIFERCPWSCHMFQPIVAFERSFAKSLAIVLTNLQLVIINLMAT